VKHLGADFYSLYAKEKKYKSYDTPNQIAYAYEDGPWPHLRAVVIA
jgi:hypothetical protein